MCASVAAAFFLGEPLTWKQCAAGCEWVHTSTVHRSDSVLVCSLFGVVLIARPASLFGRAAEADIPLSDGTGNVIEDILPTAHVTSAQRLVAVG